jgi:hypothetical protein
LLIGSTVTIGMNELQVNYSRDDGNDLPLTVLP